MNARNQKIFQALKKDPELLQQVKNTSEYKAFKKLALERRQVLLNKLAQLDAMLLQYELMTVDKISNN